MSKPTKIPPSSNLSAVARRSRREASAQAAAWHRAKSGVSPRRGFLSDDSYRLLQSPAVVHVIATDMCFSPARSARFASARNLSRLSTSLKLHLVSQNMARAGWSTYAHLQTQPQEDGRGAARPRQKVVCDAKSPARHWGPLGRGGASECSDRSDAKMLDQLILPDINTLMRPIRPHLKY